MQINYLTKYKSPNFPLNILIKNFIETYLIEDLLHAMNSIEGVYIRSLYTY